MLFRTPRARHPSPIIDNLTQTRLAWQLSNRDIARRVGVSHRTLRYAELDQVDPGISKVARWADALGYELVLRPKSD